MLGGIALAFLLAFFSLVQSVRVSATGYEIDRLANDRSTLDARRQELIADLNRLGRGPAIRKQAIDLGLDQLAEPLVVSAP
jgi:CBS domain containing-hemolysin-like protein